MFFRNVSTQGSIIAWGICGVLIFAWYRLDADEEQQKRETHWSERRRAAGPWKRRPENSE